MLVQEKLYKEGDHIARRVNELGLKLDKWKLLDWNPIWAIIFYDSEDVKMQVTPPEEAEEEEEGFGITRKKVGAK